MSTALTTLVPAVTVERDLDHLRDQINHEHAQTEISFREGMAHAMRAGDLLLIAKDLVGHGEWNAWLQRNVSFKPRTARAYMQLARLAPEMATRVADLPMREALKAIRKRSYLTPEERRAEDGVEYYPPGVVVCGEPRPAEPWEPPTPTELADDLCAQIEESLIESPEITVADLRGAFDRRFPAAPVPTEPVDVEHEVDDADLEEAPRPKGKRISKVRRWAEACARAAEALEELEDLRSEYSTIYDNMNEAAQQSPYGLACEAMASLDLQSAIEVVSEAESMNLPLGFGRD